MKNISFLIALLIYVCLYSASAYTQTYTNEEKEEDEEIEQRQRVRANPSIFGLFEIETTPNPRIQQIQGNAVFLKQVGDFNKAAIITNTQQSEVNLEQNGDYNRTLLFYNAKTAFSDLKQNGDANTIVDFIFNPNAEVSLDLIQQGDDLYFERFGSNRITETLKFNQTEAAPTIIIRSFN